MIDLTSYI